MGNFVPERTPSDPNPASLGAAPARRHAGRCPGAPPLPAGPAPRESADLADTPGCKLAPDTDRGAAAGASGERARVPGRLGGLTRRGLLCAAGSGREAVALVEAWERAAGTHGDGARAFPSQHRPTRPCGSDPRFFHSPSFLPPQTGRYCRGLSRVKFLHAPLPDSSHAAFHPFIHENLLNAHSRR